MASNNPPAAQGAGQRPRPRPKAKPAVALPGQEQDRLTRPELRKLYGYTARQLRVNPGLFDLFQKAFDGQWDKARFESELEQLPWYRKHQASYREYMLLAAEGGADFEAKKADSYEFVRRTAMNMGYNLSRETIMDLAEDSMMFGWGEPGQEYELQRAIAERDSEDGQYGGDVAANAEALKATALANGVKLDEAWFMEKAKSIASGMYLPDDAEREIREMAAQRVPGFAQQILAGQNLDALVSPWRAMMADEWELSPTQIMLDDPMLQTAIGGFDEAGAPKMMNLGEFQMALRKDPRWLNTTKAQNSITSAYSGVLKMFGMGN